MHRSFPAGEFQRRLADEFDYMVTPLVFDLELKVDPASTAAGWRMLAVYGSPNPNDTALAGNGTIMREPAQLCAAGWGGTAAYCVLFGLHKACMCTAC